MTYERSIGRYRHWYAKLLRCYPMPYYKRFGESMEQTFADLIREHRSANRRVVSVVLWMFVETIAGIIKENVTLTTMQNLTKRLMVWAAAIALILLIPLVLTLRGSGVDGEGWHWTLSDFVIIGTVMFVAGLAYELVARRSGKTAYRVAVGVGLVAAFLLFWINGAVGIIGNENQFANVLYGTVFLVGLIGPLLARFKPQGMARTLFTAAVVQLLVPVAALLIWPPPTISWSPGVFRVFILNAVFALLFAGSGLLFRRAGATHTKQNYTTAS